VGSRLVKQHIIFATNMDSSDIITNIQASRTVFIVSVSLFCFFSVSPKLWAGLKWWGPFLIGICFSKGMLSLSLEQFAGAGCWGDLSFSLV